VFDLEHPRHDCGAGPDRGYANAAAGANPTEGQPTTGEPTAEAIARKVIDTGMSVRELEALMRAANAPAGTAGAKSSGAAKPAKDADTRALERKLSDVLGLDVSIDHRGDGGTLHIKYKDLDQLDAVLRKLGG